MCLAAGVATIVAYLMSFPARRVREFYLAMMTLGFGMVFYEMVREWIAVTGGTVGFSGVPSTMLRSLVIWLADRRDRLFPCALVVTALVMLLLRNFIQSRIGRAFYAVHFSEVAAGARHFARRDQALAYTLACGSRGWPGHSTATCRLFGPGELRLPRSIEVLVITVVGGLGSMAGQILSSVVFTFLPEKLQVFSRVPVHRLWPAYSPSR